VISSTTSSALGSAFANPGASVTTALNLTALMDILSNLLFFLLASYSAQDLEIQQKSKVHLPASTSDAKLVLNLVVTVTREEIQVAGVPVAKLEGGRLERDVGAGRAGGTAEEGAEIVSLYDRLRSVQSSRKASGHEGLPGADTILLLADRSTDSSLITKVLKTAGSAGFLNVRFGVVAQ
jgi:biopolymer transport protein ExbD